MPTRSSALFDSSVTGIKSQEEASNGLLFFVMLLRATLYFSCLSLLAFAATTAAAQGDTLLPQAAALAERIQGDEEQKSDALYQLLLVAKDDRPLQERMLQHVTGYHRGLAHLALAHQQRADSAQHLAQAQRVLERTTGARADLLRAEIVRRMPEEQSSGALQQIVDTELKAALELESLIAKTQQVTAAEITQWKEKMEAVAKGNPFPSAIRLAQLLLARAEESSASATTEERVQLVSSALSLAKVSHVAYPELVLSAALLMHDLGQKQEAEKLSQWAAVDTQRMPTSYEQKYLCYAALARYWHHSGEVDKAEKLLREAELVALKQLPAPEYATAMLALAKCWQQMQKGQRAEETLLHLLLALEANPNLRLRQLAALGVMHFYLQHSCLPNERVRHAVTQVEQATLP